MCSLNLLETFEIAFTTHLSSNVNEPEYVISFNRKIMSPLLGHFSRLCFEQKLPISFENIQLLSLLFSKFISACDTDTYKKISCSIFEFTVERNIEVFVKGEEKHSRWSPFEPSKLTSAQMHLVLSLPYSFFSTHRSISAEETSINIFHSVKSYCFEYSSLDAISIKMSSVILSQIVLSLNSSNVANLTNLIQEIFSEMKCLLQTEDGPTQHKTMAVNILMWISKSLLILNHTLFLDYIQLFFELLNKETLTNEILNLIDILYSSDDFFQQPPLANVNPSQRFSVPLHQLIMEQYNQSNKSEFLFLFVSHLRFISHEMFASQISQFFLLILNGLDATHKAQINQICLSFIENLLKGNFSQVQPHLISVFRSIIALARKSPKLQIRKMALDCICLIIDMSADKEELLTSKAQFLRSLQPTLADHKRLVRTSAVKAFCKLSMLGQPGNRPHSN